MEKVQTGLTHAEVNTNTGKEETTKNKDVEDSCNDENRRKKSQTSNTPLMHGPIAQEIGFYGTSDIFLKMLHGHYTDPQEIYDYTTA